MLNLKPGWWVKPMSDLARNPDHIPDYYLSIGQPHSVLARGYSTRNRLLTVSQTDVWCLITQIFGCGESPAIARWHLWPTMDNDDSIQFDSALFGAMNICKFSKRYVDAGKYNHVLANKTTPF